MVCKNQAKNTFLVLLMDWVWEKGIFVVKSVVSSPKVMGEKCRCVKHFQTAMLLITWVFSYNILLSKNVICKWVYFE